MYQRNLRQERFAEIIENKLKMPIYGRLLYHYMFV